MEKITCLSVSQVIPVVPAADVVVVGVVAGAVVVAVVVAGVVVTAAVVAGALVTAADLVVVGSDPPEQASVSGTVIPTMTTARITLAIALIVTRKL